MRDFNDIEPDDVFIYVFRDMPKKRGWLRIRDVLVCVLRIGNNLVAGSSARSVIEPGKFDLKRGTDIAMGRAKKNYSRLPSSLLNTGAGNMTWEYWARSAADLIAPELAHWEWFDRDNPWKDAGVDKEE